MRRFGIAPLSALIGALVVVGCSAGTPSASAAMPTASSTPTTASSAASPTATPRPTPTPVPVADCPAGGPHTIRVYVDADPACFEGDEVALLAWLDFPPPMGFEGPGIEPGWLAYPAGDLSALWHSPPTDPNHICNEDTDPGCAWIFAHIDPASGLELGGKRWVLVTGHVQDPAADRCHYLPVEGSDEGLPPDEEAVAQCRVNFVVTSIETVRE